MFARQIISDIDKEMPDGSFARPGGSLLMMVGLPGAGKSYVVEQLQRLVPCIVVTTDRIRLYARTQPTYTPAEMAYIYEICYGIVDTRLARGRRVVFDASNYLAARRRRLFEIAERHGTPVTVCHVQASEEVTRQRLARRFSSRRAGSDWSDAGWSVYKWMVEAQEPIAVEHLTLDTTTGPPETLAQRLWQYWKSREAEFERNSHIQSASRTSGYSDDY